MYYFGSTNPFDMHLAPEAYHAWEIEQTWRANMLVSMFLGMSYELHIAYFNGYIAGFRALEAVRDDPFFIAEVESIDGSDSSDSDSCDSRDTAPLWHGKDSVSTASLPSVLSAGLRDRSSDGNRILVSPTTAAVTGNEPDSIGLRPFG